MDATSARLKSRVFIVDGHALVRRGLGELIQGESDLELCGEAEQSSVAFNDIMKQRPDVVTVELSLEGNSGIELIKSIRRFDANIAILAITLCDEVIYAPRAFKAGALGFISKHATNENILTAIHCVQSGKVYASEETTRQMMLRIAHRRRRSTEGNVQNLSDRELEVGELIGTGATTREIATNLHVSIKTIETHRANIKEKLGLENSARLVQFWITWVVGGEGQKDVESTPLGAATDGTNGAAHPPPADAPQPASSEVETPHQNGATPAAAQNGPTGAAENRTGLVSLRPSAPSSSPPPNGRPVRGRWENGAARFLPPPLPT